MDKQAIKQAIKAMLDNGKDYQIVNGKGKTAFIVSPKNICDKADDCDFVIDYSDTDDRTWDNCFYDMVVDITGNVLTLKDDKAKFIDAIGNMSSIGVEATVTIIKGDEKDSKFVMMGFVVAKGSPSDSNSGYPYRYDFSVQFDNCTMCFKYDDVIQADEYLGESTITVMI